jgi:hypothetical protein
MTDEQEETLAALRRRADKLGHQIEPSVKRLGYCLWQSWPGGRLMILGRNDNVGVTLDAIAQKLDEMEAGNHLVRAPQDCGPNLGVVNHHSLAPPNTPAPAAATPRSSPRGFDHRRKPLGGPIVRLGEAEMAQVYGNRSYA